MESEFGGRRASLENEIAELRRDADLWREQRDELIAEIDALRARQRQIEQSINEAEAATETDPAAEDPAEPEPAE
jgi:uncharacterized coiled-coil DUF342 family protein